MPVAAHKVILLGGSLLGWVDLWKGILVCDVLCQDPQLEVGFIPLPFFRNADNHICPWVIRDVTCTNGSLKFIEIEHLSGPPAVDESGEPDVIFDETYSGSPLGGLETEQCKFVDWRATIWNRLLSVNCWRKGFEVHGNDILVEKLVDCTVGVSTVRNLLPSFPTLSICGNDVVHMSSSARLDIGKTQMISIDMSNNTLKGVAQCPPVEVDDNCLYFPCVLSYYLANSPALPHVTRGSNSEDVNECLPQIVQPSNSENVTENESLRSCAQEVISEPNRAQDGGSNFDLPLVVQARNSEYVHAGLPQIEQTSNSENITGNKRQRFCAQQIIGMPNGTQNGGSNFDLSLVCLDHHEDADYPRQSYLNHQQSLALQQPNHLPHWLQLPTTSLGASFEHHYQQNYYLK